jgi:hypothetical protein
MGKIPKKMDSNAKLAPTPVVEMATTPTEKVAVNIPLAIVEAEAKIQKMREMTDDFLNSIPKGERERMRMLSRTLNAISGK